jgi:hypothetical protein
MFLILDNLISNACCYELDHSIMELKVHIEKTLRIVCGLNEQTTVQDVIIALAHSLKQTGRFYLIEKLNHLTSQIKNEKTDKHKKKLSSRLASKHGKNNQIFVSNSNARVMSPNERPIELLKNYSNIFASQNKSYEVEFHLIRSTSDRPEQVASELIEQINELNASSISEFINEESEIETSQSTISSSGGGGGGHDSGGHRSSTSSNSSYSSNPTNGDEMTFNFKTNASSLLENIGHQQKLLQDQASKLEKLLKKIEKYEIVHIELSQENEIFKKKLSQLEHANQINTAKLIELENDTNENLLKKEVELAEFLQAQREYYERKLSNCKFKLESNQKILIDLEISLQAIKDDFNETKNINDEFIHEYTESLKQAELNKTRLEDLNTSLMSLDQHLLQKLDQIKMLEEEFGMLKEEPSVMYEDNDENLVNSDSFSSTSSNISCSSSSSDFLAPLFESKHENRDLCNDSNNSLKNQNINSSNALMFNSCNSEIRNGFKILDKSSSIEFDHIYYF